MRMLLIENLALLLTVVVALVALRIYDLWTAATQLPERVSETLSKTFPKASIVTAAQDVRDGGRDAYEVVLADRGRQVCVEVASDGTLLEVERRAKLSKAPTAVERAIQGRLRRWKVERIDAVASNRSKFYEVRFQGIDAPLYLNESGGVIAPPPRMLAVG